MRRASLLPKSLAEVVGTFLLVFFAAGSVMVDERSGGLVTDHGEALSSGLIVMAMVYAIGHISGAHINPAVTLGFLLARRIPWSHAPAYWGAQIGGALLAAGALRAMFGNIASMGGHMPSGDVAESLGLEIVLTFSLMFVIMAVVSNPERTGSASGIVIGGTVALGVLVGGPISGGSMNPARSLGPALVGWTWTAHWLYWAGPLLGATLGASAYRLLEKGVERANRPDSEEALRPGVRRVLFACVHNSGRSQMAEAFAKHHANGDMEFESAGTMPADRVNPLVVQAMKEKGIDLSAKRPKLLTQEMADRVDTVVTMGCSIEEACPALLAPTEDWGLEDPEDKPIEAVREIRDEIEARVRRLVSDQTRGCSAD